MRYLIAAAALVLLTASTATECPPPAADIPDDLQLRCVGGTWVVVSDAAKQIMVFRGSVCGPEA